MSSGYQRMKFFLHGAGYRTGLAVADDAKIDFAQGNNFCCRTADKNLVGDIELIARDGLLDYGIAQIPRQGDEAVASYSFQNAGARRGVDDLVAVLITNHKEVLAGTLSHVTIGTQHDCLIESGTYRFRLRQN